MAKIPQSFFRRQGGLPRSGQAQRLQVQGDPGAPDQAMAQQEANSGRIDLSPIASGLDSIGQVFKALQTEKNELAKIKQQSRARTLIIQTRADLVQAHQEVQALELDDPDQVKQELYTRANGLIEKYGPQLASIGPYANEPFNQVMQSTMMNMIPELTGKAIERSQIMLNQQLDDQTQASLAIIGKATTDEERDAALNDGLEAIDALSGTTISEFKAEQLKERFIKDAIKTGMTAKVTAEPHRLREHLKWLSAQEGISEADKQEIRQAVMADVSQQQAFSEHQDDVVAAQRKVERVQNYQGIMGDAQKAVNENDYNAIDKLFNQVYEENKAGRLLPADANRLMTFLRKAASGDERAAFSSKDSAATALLNAIKTREVTAFQAEVTLDQIKDDVNAKEYKALLDEIGTMHSKADSETDKLERSVHDEVRERLESYRTMTMSQAARPGGAAQFKQQTDQLMQKVLPILDAEIKASLNAGGAKGDNWPELARRQNEIVERIDKMFGDHFKDPAKNPAKPLDQQQILRFTEQNAYGDSPMDMPERAKLWLEDKRRRESEPNYSPDKDPARVAAQQRASDQQARYQTFIEGLIGGPSQQEPAPTQPQAAAPVEGEAGIDPQNFQSIAEQIVQGLTQVPEAPGLPEVPQSVIDSLPEEFRTAVDPADIPGAASADPVLQAKLQEPEGSLQRDLAVAAQDTDVPYSYLRTVAQIESSGDPTAKNPKSSAEGLFQFIDSTARQYGLFNEDGTRNLDQAVNARAGAEFAADNKAALERAGIEVEPWMLYMAHQQGVGGAKQLIKAAETGKVTPRLRKVMDLNGGKGMSPDEFLDMWERKYARFEAKFANL